MLTLTREIVVLRRHCGNKLLREMKEKLEGAEADLPSEGAISRAEEESSEPQQPTWSSFTSRWTMGYRGLLLQTTGTSLPQKHSSLIPPGTDPSRWRALTPHTEALTFPLTNCAEWGVVRTICLSLNTETIPYT